MTRHLLPLFAASLFALAGCGETREVIDSPLINAPTLTYLGEIKALIADRCVSCHGPTKTEGSYDLSTWTGLFGGGTDSTRNLRPGDPNSRFLTKLSEDSHAALLDVTQRRQLVDWVVRDRLAYFTVGSSYHPRGWLYPGDRTSTAFHGGFLRARKWDLRDCQLCHGKDFKGGESQVSCLTCHKDGPTGCSTCHGNGQLGAANPPPSLSWGLDPKTDRGVGAHAAHLGGKRFVSVACGDCHVVPKYWDQPGHLFDDAQKRTSDFRAEVVFSAKAGANAQYDQDAGTCTVACHGSSQPNWNAPGSVTCGSCHAVPAHPTFGGGDCAACHQQNVERCTPSNVPGGDADCQPTSDGFGVRYINPALHGNGKVEVGAAGNEGTCWACHGSKATGGAPGPDLAGNTDTSIVTVGLHALHLQATNREGVAAVLGTVSCADCHKVPANVTDAGHLDADNRAEIVFSDLAKGKTRGGDLAATWDRDTATCSNIYCHNGLDGGKVSTWRWTSKLPVKLACDSCHGQPPAQTLSGNPHPASTACSTCHAQAYDPNTSLLDPTKHPNGKVEGN